MKRCPQCNRVETDESLNALAALEQAAARADFWLFSIKYDPAFEPLRGDPRFQKILTQLIRRAEQA